jgi:hypothetical protein
VSCSPAFKWFVGLLLPLTLVWKLAAGPDDPREVPKTIAQLLRQREFENVKTEEVMGGMWVVRAYRGECRLFVVELSSKGWTRELIRTFAESSDRLFIVLQGSVYEYDSTWRTAANDVYFRVLRKLGLARPTPILGVAASPICAVERLPWNEL